MAQNEKIKWEINEVLRGEVTPFEMEEVIVTVFYKELLKRNDIHRHSFKLKNFKSTKIEKAISSILKDLSNQEIRDLLLSIIANDNSSRNHFRDLSIPEDVAKLVYKLFNFKGGESVADIGCGDGYFMSYIQNEASKERIHFKDVYGIEINQSQLYIANMMSDIYVNDCSKAFYGNVFDGTNFPFNRGFCFPPFNVKLQNLTPNEQYSRYGYKFNNRNCSEWIFVDRMLKCLDEENKKYSKGIAILPPRCFYNEDDKEYRDTLIKNGKVEAIIELPAGSLKSTSIKSCIVIFSNNNKKVKLVDASKVLGNDPTRFMNTPLPVDEIINLFNKTNGIDNSKLLGSTNLIPSSFLIGQKYNFKGVPLVSIANVITGLQYTISHFEKDIVDELTGYKILTSSDIENGYVNWKDLRNINCTDSKLDKFALKKGDIVLTSKSSKVKIAVVDENLKDKIIVTGGMFIVRVKDVRINPVYIVVYLESPVGKQALRAIQRGVSIVTINIKDLERVLIPIAPKEKQDMLSKKYLNNISSYNALKEQMKNIENSLKNMFMDEIGDEE